MGNARTKREICSKAKSIGKLLTDNECGKKSSGSCLSACWAPTLGGMLDDLSSADGAKRTASKFLKHCDSREDARAIKHPNHF